MSNKKNIDEFLDPEILKSLKSLDFVIPTTIEDYDRLEQEIKKKPLTKPTRLKDPFSFIESKNKTVKLDPIQNKSNTYEQNLAWAAREGKSISDQVKQKMRQDKQDSKKSNGK